MEDYAVEVTYKIIVAVAASSEEEAVERVMKQKGLLNNFYYLYPASAEVVPEESEDV